MIMINLITELSTEVRRILEGSTKSDHHSSTCFYFGNFPTGCCGDTSIVLQYIIAHKLKVECTYVSGLHKHDSEHTDILSKDASHAWLEWDDYIIDITADQFNDRSFKNSPVMTTKNRKFHDIFTREMSYKNSNPADIDGVYLQSINYILEHLKCMN
ncbi:hypothetical protein SMW88_003610 [Cronobacter sakazakii]|uniref:hypothetical protein n=1 Tax=Cronobacter sakazakii TaxID=28141 RepID=UPI0013BC775C|nr:hypothetical protein [Cronobacter sakazakii]KAB1488099.1 hypothetical protein FZI22_12210 [Cronobacter sakazakii]